MAHVDQYGIPCAYIRGGTSKALFLLEKDIPAPGPLRDTVLKRLMGSPDAHQVDGMGGRSTHTSKIAIIGPSTREDADINFTFAQISINEDTVSWKGNCGNISSAVGPFVIDEGLVKTFRKGQTADDSVTTREIRIHNTNTKTILIAHVPIQPSSGFSISTGKVSIAGVPGTSAPILMDYRNTIGGTRENGILPTGNVIDHITVGGQDIEISIIDVANCAIFVRAKDFGLTGAEPAGQISTDTDLAARWKEIRGKGAQLIGMCKDWKLVDKQSPGLPFVIFVAPPSSRAGDVNARVIFMNLCHDTMAGTAAICTTAASRVKGSVAYQQTRPSSHDSGFLRINHPEGIMPVAVRAKLTEDTPTKTEFDVLAFERTSRRLMAGTVYLPLEVWSGPGATNGLTNGAVNGTKEMRPKKTNLLITGDINLLNVKDPRIPLNKVAETLNAADVVISNLECLLDTPSKTHSIEVNEGFFADPVVGVEALKYGGIAAVGIANNINYGASNILGSVATLDKAGIPHTGAGENIDAARKPVIIERGGRRYGFIQRTSVYWPTDHAADKTAPGIAPLPAHTAYEAPMYRYHAGIPPVNRAGIPPIIKTWVDAKYLAAYVADLKELRPHVDVLIASNHWGLKKEPLTYMEEIAKAAIEAGADIVMGHGPHYSLPVGFHNGKPIFYGLGSFSFHTGHLGAAHGDWVGLLASLDLTKDAANPEVSFRLVRHNHNNETYLCHPSAETETVKYLQEKSEKYGASLVVEGDSIVARPL